MKIETGNDIYELAKTHKVTMDEACARAGVARSGPARWLYHDVEPRLSTLHKLRDAILQIAEEREANE